MVVLEVKLLLLSAGWLVTEARYRAADLPMFGKRRGFGTGAL